MKRNDARVVSVAVLTVIVAVACAGDGPGAGGAAGEWRAETDTIGDTVVVRTVAGTVWGDTAALESVWRIGSMEGEDAEIIGSPPMLDVTPDGTLVFLDAQVPIVRAYGPDGTHRFDVGREGGGPGEYANPDGIAVLPDGRLLVRDPGNRRISVFGPDGAYLEAWDHPTGGGFNTDRTFYVDTAATAWVSTLADFTVGPWDWTYILVGIDSAGQVTDTVRAPVFDFEKAQLTASRENSRSVRRVPFTAEQVWSLSPFGYTVGAVTDRYAIDLFRTNEPVLRIERANPDPVPVAPEEAAERKQRITASLQRQYGSWRWNGPDVPATKPPIRDVFVDDEGRIWVAVSRPGEPVMTEAEATAEEARTGRRPLRFEEPLALEVFDRDGRYLGPVRVPAGLQLEPRPVIRGEDVWAVVRGEMGVPYVVRYRLVRDGSQHDTEKI